MKNDNLLPCPFCGSEHLQIYSLGRYDNDVYIKCIMCFGQISGQGEEHAIERWNTRTLTEKEE